MMGDLYIKGLVTIRQGEEILANEVPNKFTNQGLSGILCGIATTGAFCNAFAWYYWYLPSNTWSIYLGSNTSTVTTPVMTALVNPIGAAPGTAPNTKTISVKSGATDGIWAVTWTATWTAGTVSGILGELGLYLKWSQNVNYRYYADNYNPGVIMGNRLSSADNEFASFTIDNTKPLAIDWKIQFSFN